MSIKKDLIRYVGTIFILVTMFILIGILTPIEVASNGLYSNVLIEVFSIVITVLVIEQYIKYRSEEPRRELIKETFHFLPKLMFDALFFTFKELYKEDVTELGLKKIISDIEIVAFIEKKRAKYEDYKAIEEHVKRLDKEGFGRIKRQLTTKYLVVLGFLKGISHVFSHYPARLQVIIRNLISSLEDFVSSWKDKAMFETQIEFFIIDTMNPVYLTGGVLEDFQRVVKEKISFS